MKNNHIFTILFVFLLFSQLACTQKIKTESPKVMSSKTQDELQGFSVAYFAAGCFWCVEAIFESVEGVEEAFSGYSGGDTPNPTYQEVSAGRLKHAEAVAVYYNSEKVSFETLVKVFFASQDPTTLNQQGPDRGLQYRSLAFYNNETERTILENYIAQLTVQKVYNAPIVTELVPFEKFWLAEDYHQNYERLHPENPYVQNISIPRLKKFQKQFPELLKKAQH